MNRAVLYRWGFAGTAVVASTFAWSAFAGGGAPLVPVTHYGADPTGEEDSSLAFVNGLSALAGKGFTLYVPPGTYRISEKWITPSDTTLSFSQGAVIHQDLTAGAGAPLSDDFIYNVAQQGGIDGTVAVAPVIGSTLVTVSLNARPPVGKWLELTQANAAGGDAVYRILGSSKASPYVVVLDRPIVFPFAAGDVADVLEMIPQNIQLIGNGAKVSGTGDQTWELARGENAYVRELGYDASLGTVYGVGGFDQGMRNSVAENCSADCTGMPAHGAGYYMQSNEGSQFRSMNVTNPPVGGAGFSVMDSFASGIESSWVFGGPAGSDGFVYETLSSGYGNIDCWLLDSGVVGSGGTGLEVLTGTNTLVKDFTARACLSGVVVGVGARQTYLEDISSTYNSGWGVVVLAGSSGTMFEHVDVSHNLGGPATTSYAAFDAYTDVDVDDLTAVLGADEAYTALRHQAGLATVRNVTITSAKTSGVAVAALGTRMQVDHATIVMQGGGGAVGFLAGAGVLQLENVSVSGAGTCGLFISPGATVRLGSKCDFSATAVPIYVSAGGYINQGTFTAQGPSPVIVSFPDMKQSDKVSLTPADGAAAPTGTVTISAGQGFAYVGSTPDDTGTYSYVIGP